MKNHIIISFFIFSILFLVSCGLENVENNPLTAVAAANEVCKCFENERGQGVIANYPCLDKNREYVEMYSAMATPNDSSAINTYSAIAGLCILTEIKSRLEGDDEE